eukprot:8403528-Pyramimonas_sp.AAC.1
MNDAILIFAPKGKREDDSQCVVREPAATRPLALKNTDIKVLSSVCNFQFKRMLSPQAQEDQKGFL